MRAPRLRTGLYYDLSQSPALVKYIQPVALSTTLNLAPVESLTISAFGSPNVHYVNPFVRGLPAADRLRKSSTVGPLDVIKIRRKTGAGGQQYWLYFVAAGSGPLLATRFPLHHVQGLHCDHPQASLASPWTSSWL